MGLLAADRKLLTPYLEGLEEGGFTPEQARMTANPQFVLADDPPAAWERIIPHLAYQWETYRRYGMEGTGRPPPPALDVEAWCRTPPDVGVALPVRGDMPLFRVLTPSQAESQLRSQTQGLPVGEIYCWASIAGMPDDLVWRNVELLCTALAPAIASF